MPLGRRQFRLSGAVDEPGNRRSHGHGDYQGSEEKTLDVPVPALPHEPRLEECEENHANPHHKAKNDEDGLASPRSWKLACGAGKRISRCLRGPGIPRHCTTRTDAGEADLLIASGT